MTSTPMSPAAQRRRGRSYSARPCNETTGIITVRKSPWMFLSNRPAVGWSYISPHIASGAYSSREVSSRVSQILLRDLIVLTEKPER